MRPFLEVVRGAGVAATMLAYTSASTLASESVSSAGGHVRSLEPRIAAALRAGFNRSPTLAALVRDLDASDVIVYLHTGLCGSAVACTTIAAGRGEIRLLRVSLVMPDSGRGHVLAYRDRLIAQIAHELQHALEIADAREAVDEAGVVRLYERIGERADASATRYETAAARRVTAAVALDLRAATRRGPPPLAGTR